MNKLKDKIVFITIAGVFIFLGPFLQMESMAEPGLFGIPKSYLFILITTLVFIFVTARILIKSDW